MYNEPLKEMAEELSPSSNSIDIFCFLATRKDTTRLEEGLNNPYNLRRVVKQTLRIQRLQPWKFPGSEISTTGKYIDHHPSMHSMLKLGGLGACPQENFQNKVL